MNIERVIDRLWPDADLITGRNRLYVVSHRLRRALGSVGKEAVAVTAGTMELQESPFLRVDAWQLVDATAKNPPDVTSILELYRGDFCTEQLAYEDFAEDYRVDLRRQFVRAITAEIRRHLDADRPDAAHDLASRLAALVPSDADLAVLAVSAALRAGLVDAAREQAIGFEIRLRSSGFDTEDYLAAVREAGLDLHEEAHAGHDLALWATSSTG